MILRSLLLFLAIGAGLIAGLNWFGLKFEGTTLVRSERADLMQISGSEIYAIGPSSARALIPEAMCIEGYTLKQAGLDLFESAAIVRHGLDMTDPPDIWMLGMVPMAQAKDNGSSAASLNERRVRTYRHLRAGGDWRLVDNDWRGAFRSFAFPTLGWNAWEARLDRFSQVAGLGRIIHLEARNPEEFTPEVSARAAQTLMNSLSSQMGRMDYWDPDIAQRAEENLLMLDRQVRDQGAVLVLVVLPVPEVFHAVGEEHLPQKMRDFHGMLSRLEDQGVAVLRRGLTQAWRSDLSLFRDNLHLTEHSSQTFSRQLRSDLIERGITAPGEC